VKKTYDELEAARRKAADAERLKTEFLASISHELRTPLTAIASAAKILVKHGAEKPDSVQKFAPVIAEQAARLTRLLDEVLDLARMESGQVTWRDDVFRPAEAAASVAEMFRPQADERGITLNVHIRPLSGGDGWIRGDRDRIIQVLVNLMSNALKFTPSGGSIRIASARVGAAEAAPWGILPHEGRGAVLLAIDDTGVGIAPENQVLIFEKFRQVVDDTSGKPEGTGLGLSICKDIVERHGGRLGLRSAPGKGSRFTVALPEVVGP
jgi:signal transduction histidine kinase